MDCSRGTVTVTRRIEAGVEHQIGPGLNHSARTAVKLIRENSTDKGTQGGPSVPLFLSIYLTEIPPFSLKYRAHAQPGWSILSCCGDGQFCPSNCESESPRQFRMNASLSFNDSTRPVPAPKSSRSSFQRSAAAAMSKAAASYRFRLMNQCGSNRSSPVLVCIRI
jgi:hypothetical protein